MRFKLIVWFTLYGFITWLFQVINTMYASEILPEGVRLADVIFGQATLISVLLTLFAPILGGADLKARNLSPDRASLYTRHFLINLAGWAAAYSINAIALIIIMGVSSAVYPLIGLVILLGTIIMAISSLVSVFTNSLTQSLLVSFELIVTGSLILSFLLRYLPPTSNEFILLTMSLVALGIVAALWVTAGRNHLAQNNSI